MKAYYIHTEATEDKPEMTCSYGYSQFKEVVSSLKKAGVKFTTWSEPLYFESGIK